LSLLYRVNLQSLTSMVGSVAAATNPRGIPTAPFVEKVEDYIATRADVEPALRKFQEMISYAAILPIPKTDVNHIFCRKYQFMEVNTQRRALSLRDKIPDIQKTLDTVRFLKVRKVGVLTAGDGTLQTGDRASKGLINRAGGYDRIRMSRLRRTLS